MVECPGDDETDEPLDGDWRLIKARTCREYDNSGLRQMEHVGKMNGAQGRFPGNHHQPAPFLDHDIGCAFQQRVACAGRHGGQCAHAARADRHRVDARGSAGHWSAPLLVSKDAQTTMAGYAPGEVLVQFASDGLWLCRENQSGFHRDDRTRRISHDRVNFPAGIQKPCDELETICSA